MRPMAVPQLSVALRWSLPDMPSERCVAACPTPATPSPTIRSSTAVNSKTEPANMKVGAEHSVAKGCYYRIMPRYKVRSVGEAVTVNDEIVFEVGFLMREHGKRSAIGISYL